MDWSYKITYSLVKNGELSSQTFQLLFKQVTLKQETLKTLFSIPQTSHEAAVVTCGTFDGLHLGHRRIIESTTQTAAEKKLPSIAVTFWPHPRRVLYPDDNDLRLLSEREEKLKILETLGLDYQIEIPFTRDFSRLSALEFVRDILVKQLRMDTLVVGYDHHFGRNREGSIGQMNEYAGTYGFEVREVGALTMKNEPISSSRIRKAILQGHIENANEMLGYPYSFAGTVIRGDGRGRTIGFPTANVLPSEPLKLIPETGVYVVSAKINGERLHGMMNIGFHPTFQAADVSQCEVNLFDFDRDIYGESIRVMVHKRIRAEEKFSGVDALINRLHHDKEIALSFFQS